MASKKQHYEKCNDEECGDECSCGHEHHEQSDPADERQTQREMLELNVMDVQLRQLEQQSIMAEQQIVEQQSLLFSLDEFKSAKKGQEMLFPFSREIFVRGKLESPELIVNVGSKHLVKKNIDEAKKLVDSQMKKLLEVNEEIRSQMEKVMRRINELESKLR
jgi:prefoldin alpha subunit